MADAALERISMDLNQRKEAGLPIAPNTTPVTTNTPEPTTTVEPAKPPEVGEPTRRFDPDPTVVISGDEARKIREDIAAQAQAQQALTEKIKP